MKGRPSRFFPVIAKAAAVTAGVILCLILNRPFSLHAEAAKMAESQAENDVSGMVDTLNQLTSASFNKRVDQLVLLLMEFENCRMQSFDRGLGPVDKRFWQIVILESICQINGRPEIASRDLPAATDRLEPEQKKWRELLSISADDVDDILKLLRHSDAVARYWGIRKLGPPPYPPEIENELRRIAQQDPYIMIVERENPAYNRKSSSSQMSSREKLMSIMNSREKVVSSFAAPIRNAALQKLNAAGIDISIDQEQLTREGILMLAEMYEHADQSLRRQIIGSVKFFSPDTLPFRILMSFDGSDTTKEKAEIIALFRRKLEETTESRLKYEAANAKSQ